MHNFHRIIHTAQFQILQYCKGEKKKKEISFSMESSPLTRIILNTDLSAFKVIQRGFVSIRDIEMKLEKKNIF